MCPRGKRLAFLMDSHFSKSSFQPRALERAQSEFEVTPHCEDCLTFGEALPRSETWDR